MAFEKKLTIPLEERVIYVKIGVGDDSEAGGDWPEAYSTMSAGLTAASAISPPPVNDNPVSLICDSAALTNEALTIGESVQVESPNITIIDAITGPVLDMGSNSSIDAYTIANLRLAADAIGIRFNSVDSVIIDGDIIFGFTGIQNTGSAFNNAVVGEALSYVIDGVINNSTGTGTFSSRVQGYQAAADGAVAVNQASSVCDMNVDGLTISSAGFANTKGVICSAGMLNANFFCIEAATAIETSGTGEAIVRAAKVEGDIVIGAGTTATLEITDFDFGTYTVTVNGTLNGRIGENRYGTWDVGEVDSVTGGTNIDVDNTDPKNPIVNLPANITSQQVNGVTLTNAGAGSSYLADDGTYKPHANGDVTGPASSTDNALAVFDGTSGKLLKDSTKSIDDVVTGPVSATDQAVPVFNGTSGKILADSTKLLPSGDIVGTTDSQALTNKSVNGVTLSSSGTTDSLREDGTYQAGVDSVTAGTNVTVTGTATDPIINVPVVGGQVDSVVAGDNITVDNADPSNPIVNAVLKEEDYDIDATLRSTTNDGGFDACHTYVTKSLPSGDYNIRIPITCRATLTVQDITYRIMVDTGGGLVQVGQSMVEEMKDSGTNQRYKRSLSARVNLPSDGTMTVQLEFGVVGGFITNQCYESEIYVSESNA